MKAVGYALITLGAVALVRGLWLMTPVAGWIGLALVLYVVGHHLSRSGAERSGRSVQPDKPRWVLQVDPRPSTATKTRGGEA